MDVAVEDHHDRPTPVVAEAPADTVEIEEIDLRRRGADQGAVGFHRRQFGPHRLA